MEPSGGALSHGYASHRTQALGQERQPRYKIREAAKIKKQCRNNQKTTSCSSDFRPEVAIMRFLRSKRWRN